MTLKVVKHQVIALKTENLTELSNEYHGYWADSSYAVVEQKWLVLRSEQATKREQHTLERSLLKDSEKEIKLFNTTLRLPDRY